MTKITEQEIDSLFRKPVAREYFALDETISAQARMALARLQARFEELFGFKSRDMADEMLNQSAASSASSLKISLQELAQNLVIKTDFINGELKDVISASISENVNLIQSIPQQYLKSIHTSVMQSITTGRGLADLVPALAKQKDISLKRARLIAYDQTRKAFSNINRVRMEKLGIRKFEWLHSAGGQEPRPLHIKSFESGGLNGGIFDFDNPPIIDEKSGERGYPGQLINCKCRMIPVVHFEDDDE